MKPAALVIGGGVFGCHTAYFLAERGLEVVLIEQDEALIQRASIVNQARLHAGYHYPRAIATALASDHYLPRFREDFAHCIHSQFTHYYAIARRGSLTDAAQFQHFCAYLQLPCEAVDRHPAFNYEQLEAVFAAQEDSFDPLLLAKHYRQLIQSHPRIKVLLQSRINQVLRDANTFRITVAERQSGKEMALETSLVVNATYSSINTINQQFGLADIPLQHEIAEMAFVRVAPNFSQAAITIMDGPFCSLMPYGKTGLHSLSSVAYTHQRVSYGAEPNFGCMDREANCQPNATAICSVCASRPASNYPKMLSQLRRYLLPTVGLNYQHSRYTIKAKLQTNTIDDGRPTEVLQLLNQPAYFCVFAGKVNNIYAVEEALDTFILKTN